MNEVEAILYTPINEDNRNYGRSERQEMHVGQDWRVWSGQGYGQRVLSSLTQGRGYSYEVSDMGKSIAVRASYHNPATGRGVEKTYIILFDDPKTNSGTVFATSTKWRTVANPEQAASYISMSIKGYASSTSTT